MSLRDDPALVLREVQAHMAWSGAQACSSEKLASEALQAGATADEVRRAVLSGVDGAAFALEVILAAPRWTATPEEAAEVQEWYARALVEHKTWEEGGKTALAIIKRYASGVSPAAIGVLLDWALEKAKNPRELAATPQFRAQLQRCRPEA
jgi:hypothetical protein